MGMTIPIDQHEQSCLAIRAGVRAGTGNRIENRRRRRGRSTDRGRGRCDRLGRAGGRRRSSRRRFGRSLMVVGRPSNRYDGAHHDGTAATAPSIATPLRTRSIMTSSLV